MNIRESVEACVGSLGLSAHTLMAYRQGLLRFCDYLLEQGIGSTSPVGTIQIDHLIGFYQWIVPKYSKSSITVMGAAVQTFLNWMVIANIMTPSYQDVIRLTMVRQKARRKRESKLPRFPNRDDVSKLLLAARESAESSPRKERNIALVEFLASTGCRIMEVVQLRVRDLDMANRTTVVMGKGEKERRVWFSQSTADALKAYWLARGSDKPNEPVFARHDKRVSNQIKPITTNTGRNVVKELMPLAHVDRFSPHYFRHAFAIRVLSETKNLALVQDLLGHRNPASTRVYAKIYQEDVAQAHHQVFG